MSAWWPYGRWWTNERWSVWYGAWRGVGRNRAKRVRDRIRAGHLTLEHGRAPR